MKAGAKAVKAIGKKKVNHYSAEECKAELARLDESHKNKDGVVMGDSSQYRKDIKERLESL